MGSKLKLYNSLTRSKEDFKPLEPPKVGLYTCGPTVYNYLHVGNYRTYVFEDVLRRAFGLLGYRVRHVMNITDVGHLTSQADEGEDKMQVAAAREGKTAWQIAAFYTEAFQAECRWLNILEPDVLCKATDHIPEQIAMIRALESNGLIYRASDGVYFDTGKFPAYGRMTGDANIQGLKAGARVDANPEKRHTTDFAVWKFSAQGVKRQMEWDSPWGRGFPGWHIECSAMAMKYLGETFDVHCGGVDHIPIHHTNEIAQSEGATGKPFVKYWLHGEFLLLNSSKMAKSEGGFITLSHLKERGFDPLDFRALCLTAHYRRQLDFSWESLESAKTARRRLRDAALDLAHAPAQPACPEHAQAFREALSDDLNCPEALAAVWACLRSDAPAGARKALLELAESVFALGAFAQNGEASPEAQALLAKRQAARAARDFAQADVLRKELLGLGVIVEDTREGQKWRLK